MNLCGGRGNKMVYYQQIFEPELPEKPVVFSESFENWKDYEPIVRLKKANHQLAKALLNQPQINFHLFTLDQELELESVLDQPLNNTEKNYVYLVSKLYRPQTLLEKMNVNLIKVNHITRSASAHLTTFVPY